MKIEITNNDVKIFTKKYFIKFLIVIISIIGIYFWINNIKINNEIKNNEVVYEGGYLKKYILLEITPKEDKNLYMNLLEIETNKKHENILLASIKDCKNWNNPKNYGKTMFLILAKKINTYNMQKSIFFDRAFDYMCTDKDMEKLTKELIEKNEKK